MNWSDEELRALGATLREIDPSALQSDPEDGNLRWFQGEGGIELFVWARSHGVDHVQLALREVSVEWSEGAGLSTGAFGGGAAPLGGRYDAYVVRPAATLDWTVCRAGLQLLEASPVAIEAAAPFVQALREVVEHGPSRPP